VSQGIIQGFVGGLIVGVLKGWHLLLVCICFSVLSSSSLFCCSGPGVFFFFIPVFQSVLADSVLYQTIVSFSPLNAKAMHLPFPSKKREVSNAHMVFMGL
jgi:hypothetical protein